MGKHAKLSPSGCEGWSRCAGWGSNPARSIYSDEGTAAHFLASTCLLAKKDAIEYAGVCIHVADGEEGGGTECFFGDIKPIGNGETVFTVDEGMIEAVQVYLDIVRAQPGQLYVELALPLTHITGEVGAEGTTDAAIVHLRVLTNVDFKYGKGVQVSAVNNPQLRMYGAAGLEHFSLIEEFDEVRMVIVQPRLNYVSEEVLSVSELREWAENLKPASTMTPGEKQCRWCVNKPTCPAIHDKVSELFDAIPDPESGTELDLGMVVGFIDMIEGWIDSVRSEVKRRLLKGTPVPGWKLVMGRKGDREWANVKEAVSYMISRGLKEEDIYTKELISPAKIEKLLKLKASSEDKSGVRKDISKLVTQSPGNPTVVIESDKRPAIVVGDVSSDFDDVSE